MVRLEAPGAMVRDWSRSAPLRVVLDKDCLTHVLVQLLPSCWPRLRLLPAAASLNLFRENYRFDVFIRLAMMLRCRGARDRLRERRDVQLAYMWLFAGLTAGFPEGPSGPVASRRHLLCAGKKDAGYAVNARNFAAVNPEARRATAPRVVLPHRGAPAHGADARPGGLRHDRPEAPRRPGPGGPGGPPVPRCIVSQQRMASRGME